MIIGTIFRLGVALIIIFLILAYSPGFLDISPQIVVIKPCPAFEGGLAPNSRLNSVEKLYDSEIEGPESIAFYKDDIFTGLADGRIVKIHEDQITTIAQIGKADCEGRWEEDVCGRPLGMRFDAEGNLFVTDAYYGLYRVNVETGKVTTLHPNHAKVDGEEIVLANDLVLSESGDIYFTDSARWPLKEGIFEVLEGAPNGRLLHHDPKKNITKTLLAGLSFANGVQLSPNEDYILVCESFKYRIMKYYLKGEKKGQLEIFAENLPGPPDNIRPSKSGGYWVALCSTRIPGHISPTETLAHRTVVRKVWARLIHLIRSGIQLLNTFASQPVFKELHYKMAHMSPMAKKMAPQYGLIVEINEQGVIERSLHATNGNVRFISEVAEHEDHLYLGSPWHTFVGKVKL